MYLPSSHLHTTSSELRVILPFFQLPKMALFSASSISVV